MRRIRRDGDGVLVTACGDFDDAGRNLGLLDKTLCGSSSQIDNARNPSARRDLCDIQYILNDIKLKIVLLFESGSGDPDRNGAIGYCRTEDRYARLVGRSHNTVFAGDFGQFAAKQM